MSFLGARCLRLVCAVMMVMFLMGKMDLMLISAVAFIIGNGNL